MRGGLSRGFAALALLEGIAMLDGPKPGVRRDLTDREAERELGVRPGELQRGREKAAAADAKRQRKDARRAREFRQ